MKVGTCDSKESNCPVSHLLHIVAGAPVPLGLARTNGRHSLGDLKNGITARAEKVSPGTGQPSVHSVMKSARDGTRTSAA
jgi:hypothetical protein